MKTISDRRRSSYQIYDSFRIKKYYFRLKENFNKRGDMERKGQGTKSKSLYGHYVVFSVPP